MTDSIISNLQNNLQDNTRTTKGSEENSIGDLDDFLVLLTTQLKSQDPLNPMNPTEFVAQLASFSTVEQLVSLNERFDGLAESFEQQFSTSGADLIGRAVSWQETSPTWRGYPINFEIPQIPGISNVEILLEDGEGQELDRVSISPDSLDTIFRWEPENTSGLLLNSSKVSATILYSDSLGTARSTKLNEAAEVVAIELNEDEPKIQLNNGETLNLSEIIRVF